MGLAFVASSRWFGKLVSLLASGSEDPDPNGWHRRRWHPLRRLLPRSPCLRSQALCFRFIHGAGPAGRGGKLLARSPTATLADRPDIPCAVRTGPVLSRCVRGGSG